ncbi:hypothetical protein SESBI_36491 [Sesbania bispinosa]|nr:hypothetical protein SESBI_36491 [Sesbania bispinosa]
MASDQPPPPSGNLLTDRELKESIRSMKRTIKTCAKFLPDKGAKLLATIKAFEQEPSRRKVKCIPKDCPKVGHQVKTADGMKRKIGEDQVHDDGLQEYDNSTRPPPKRRQSLVQIASSCLESFNNKMDMVTHHFAKIAANMPDPSEKDLVEEVKKLGLTEEEEIDLVIKFSQNQQFEKFFWEFHGSQRMSFVRKIMRM